MGIEDGRRESVSPENGGNEEMGIKKLMMSKVLGEVRA